MKFSILKSFLLATVAVTFIFTACQSKPKNDELNDINAINDINEETQLTEEDLSEEDTSDEIVVLEEPAEVVIPPTEAELFVQSLEGITLQIVEAPTKWINYGKTFNAPYTVLVTDAEGNPVSNFSVSVNYPGYKDGCLIYSETENVLTNEEGKYSFVPKNTKFAADSKVLFYPTISEEIGLSVQDDPAQKDMLEAAIKAKQVSADYRVRSNVVSKGALLFIWDYNEKNRPVNNSYEILAQFRNRGMTLVGNAPTSDSSYIGDSLETLYKENYDIVQDSYGYLICGSVKFTKPVEKVEGTDDYLCSLIAEITAVSMKDGTKVFENTFTQEATGANWTKATGTCKEDLSKQIVDALLYGL